MRHRNGIAAVVAVLGLLAGALSAGGQFLPLLLDGVGPRIGTLALLVSVGSFLLTPVGLLVVGYWAGARTDVAAEYGRLLLVFGLVGGGATALGYLAVTGIALAEVSNDGFRTLLGMGYNAVVQAVSFAITGFAGAALAEFRGR